MFIVLTYNLIFFYLLSRLVSSFNFFWQSYKNILNGIQKTEKIFRL